MLFQTACRPVREIPPPAAPERPSVSERAPAGSTRYLVVPAESDVRVLVYRDGPMARLGHNHVLASRALTGEVLLGPRDDQRSFSLVLPVASFSVDEAELRAEEGGEFAGAMEPGDIAGTRRNLLGEAVLDAARFPAIRLTSRAVAGAAPDYAVTVAVEVKGGTHELTVPVLLEKRPTELVAAGRFTVTHRELGLTPFTVMGGLLSVRDEIRVSFRIVARQG